jgi:hypothetical protein
MKHIRRQDPAQQRTRWAAAALGLLVLAGTAQAAGKTYTLDADFALGLLDGVNYDAPNSNQLQLNAIGTTFPVLWIANAGEDTLSKIDTNTNKEIARYRTWFGPAGQPGYVNHIGNAYAGAAPSRPAVDIQGNAYVLNRHFDGRTASLVKILSEGGIDRNGNGVIDTSVDLNNNGIIEPAEMLPMADTNGNGIIDPSEIQDERIAWVLRTPDGVGAPLRNGALGRSLCIGTDGNLWVGLYNDQTYYKIRASDGGTISGPHPIGVTPYGCLVDQAGVLWSANLGSSLGRLNTGTLAAGPTASFGGSSYGIALGNGKVYLATYSGANGKPYIEFDPATNTFSTPAAINFGALGVAVDGSGNIIAGKYTANGVAKFAPNGAVLWDKPGQPGTGEVRGVAVDANNDVWLIHRTTDNISKYRGSDGTPLGVFPIGNQPYTYSDAAGFAARNITNSTGTWTVVYDGAAAGTAWGTINWNDLVPAGSSVIVQARTADTEAGLSLVAYQPVGKNVAFDAAGRYIQIQARLSANQAGDSPILYDLTVATKTAAICDVDNDGDIDKNDTALISRARGQTALPGDPRDSDGDGKITPNDVKVCIPLCTRANCAIQ